MTAILWEKLLSCYFIAKVSFVSAVIYTDIFFFGKKTHRF